MGNYTIFQMFENSRRGRQARNFTTNVPKILDLKSSSEEIFSDIDVGCLWSIAWKLRLQNTGQLPEGRDCPLARLKCFQFKEQHTLEHCANQFFIFRVNVNLTISVKLCEYIVSACTNIALNVVCQQWSSSGLCSKPSVSQWCQMSCGGCQGSFQLIIFFF